MSEKCENWRRKRREEREREQFNALPLEEKEQILEALVSELEAKAKKLLQEVEKNEL